MDYGRVFAFDNFKRTHKRALEAQVGLHRGTWPGVPVGRGLPFTMYVYIQL